MATTSVNPTSGAWTAVELRRLLAEQRDAILVAAAAQASVDYLHDAALTAFEAFSKDDLHGESANSEAR